MWNVVKDVLCLDSPEGHVPTDTEEEEFDLGIKDALSFSWRALKEARWVRMRVSLECQSLWP